MLDLAKGQKDTRILVVRITTSYWHDKRSIHSKKTITFLKRKSTGHNFILEDCQSIGADEVIPYITNFDTYDDGLYEIDVHNVGRDEYGNVDDYDYILKPYEERSNGQNS